MDKTQFIQQFMIAFLADWSAISRRAQNSPDVQEALVAAELAWAAIQEGYNAALAPYFKGR